MGLSRTYPLKLLEDGSLVLYDYEDEAWLDRVPGFLFYLIFVVIWAGSFVAPLYILYYLISMQRPFMVATYICMVVWTYWKYFDGSRIKPHLQLLIFYEVPKYFRASSFRVMKPQEHEGLKCLIELFDKAECEWLKPGNKGIPARYNLRYKEVRLTVPTIIALSTAQNLKASKATAAPDIFCCSPHGFISIGWGQLSMCPFFNNVYNCVSSVLYYMGHCIIAFTSCLGIPHPATSESMDASLAAGRSLSIVLGGFEEATISSESGDRLWLKSRFGVFKKAAACNATIVPYFAFGECSLFHSWEGGVKWRLLLNKISLPGAVCYSSFPLFWIPRRRELHIVVDGRLPGGKSMQELKRAYETRLVKLHEQHGEILYGPAYQPLKIM